MPSGSTRMKPGIGRPDGSQGDACGLARASASWSLPTLAIRPRFDAHTSMFPFTMKQIDPNILFCSTFSSGIRALVRSINTVSIKSGMR